MSTERDAKGRRFLVCSNCGVESPHRPKAKDARAVAKAAGWARSYPRGVGEDFFCPRCRRR